MHEEKVRTKYLKKQGVRVCCELWESFWLHTPAAPLFTYIYVPAPIASHWGTDGFLHGQHCLQLCAGRQAAFKSTSPQNLSVSIEKRQGNTGWLSWAGRKGWFSSAFSKNRSTEGQSPVEYLNQAQLKNQQVNGGTYICHFGLQDWMTSPGQK